MGDVYKAKKTFNAVETLGSSVADKAASLVLSFEKGDRFQPLQEDDSETKTWSPVVALKTNSLGYVPKSYMKVEKNTEELDDVIREIRHAQLLVLEELKSKPEFQHPEQLNTRGMIPDPDYSDSEEGSGEDSREEFRSMSPQCNRLASVNQPANPDISHISVATDDDGIIMPRKLIPNSKEKQNLHKELLFNQKIGKNVLGQKSELKKVLDKFQDEQKKKELENERLSKRSPFEIKLEEQANKLKLIESLQERASEELVGQSEFQKVHAKVRAKADLQ